jgi:Zn-dependent peptidase ImmA (M78 family)
MLQLFQPFRFLEKQEIEATAIAILQQMQQTPNYQPKFPLDTSRVAEFLGLDVVWDSISDDSQGTIAARIMPLQRLIEMNENLPKLREGLGESTIAHEIGHWVLHINVEAVDEYVKLQQTGNSVPTETLLCRYGTQLTGIEWQAQYFASCLLMPRYQLEKVCQGRDLTQWRQLYQVTEEFGVTISNLIHRLKDVGWIELSENTRQLRYGTTCKAGV